MFCTNCGKKIEQAHKFCGSCGNPVGKDDCNSVNTRQQQSESSLSCKVCSSPLIEIYIGLDSTSKYVCKVHDVVPGVCPHCQSKLRTDKAQQCPTCHASWRDARPTEFSKEVVGDRLVKCPKCNTTQVTSSRKGFGVKRALAGAVLVGPLGLLAGATGRKKIELSCLKCGHRWSA